jgi:multiple sugar transport system ATP-binding protein
MASVSIRNVSLNFGSVAVLQELSLDIEKGEFLVLLGPSGCGKSTLLNCIAGLLDVSSGQIHINGRNVTWEEPKDRGIGMVFQSYALYPQMSVEGNLSFGLKNAGLPTREITTRIARAAEILQIGPLLKRKPAQLSGGQRQRVAIGRALVRDVDVFLFDEPLSNLDARLRTELRVEIKRLHQRLGNTMIYVTHDQIEALTLADRIAVMKSGVVQQLDSPLTIYNRPRNRYVAGFIGSPAMNFLPGEIRGAGGDAVFASGSMTVPLTGYLADRPLQPGAAVLGVRPEHIRLKPTEEARIHAFDAPVEIIETMGTDSLIWVSHSGKPVSVRVDAARAPARGDKVSLHFDLSLASLFDAASEDRL